MPPNLPPTSAGRNSPRSSLASTWRERLRMMRVHAALLGSSRRCPTTLPLRSEIAGLSVRKVRFPRFVQSWISPRSGITARCPRSRCCCAAGLPASSRARSNWTHLPTNGSVSLNRGTFRWSRRLASVVRNCMCDRMVLRIGAREAEFVAGGHENQRLPAGGVRLDPVGIQLGELARAAATGDHRATN